MSLSLYYLWKGMGYEDKDLQTLSVSQIDFCIDEVDRVRNEEREKFKTREDLKKLEARPKFSEDLKDFIKHNDTDKIKKRWKGIKGLDGDYDENTGLPNQTRKCYSAECRHLRRVSPPNRHKSTDKS